MMDQHAAILFFSLTAEEESKVKRFVSDGGRKGNFAVANALIQHSNAVARKTQLPIFRSSGANQQGANFGERLANALESVYERGYEKVIVIGNDCPDISTQLLLDTNEQLEHTELVLGPANDGGIYLLGIRKDAYRREAFLEMAWQSAALQSSWRSYAIRDTKKIVWLETHFDIDNAADLHFYISGTVNSLKQCLICILSSYQHTYTEQALLAYSSRQFYNMPLRAPPHSSL